MGIRFLFPFLIPLALRGSTSYMPPQNLGTARAVSRSKTISTFLAKGFLCKRPLGERKSYLSYSQKLSDQHFLAWHKPRWATQYSPGMESPRNFQLVNKVDCYVPCALCNAIVRAFLATKPLQRDPQRTPAIWHASQSQSRETSYLQATIRASSA